MPQDEQKANWPGQAWRFLVRDWRHPDQEVHHLQGDGSSWFDELVVGDWLHIEWMQGRNWWMRLGDARISITIPEGKPPIIQIERDEYGTRPTPSEEEQILAEMDPDDGPYGSEPDAEIDPK